MRYAHLIVIECAMCLYGVLLKESAMERPKGDTYGVKPRVVCPPAQAVFARIGSDRSLWTRA